MARGPKPAKSKGAKPPVARKSSKNEDSRVRDLENLLTEALKDKAEALDRETATSEILRVISSSPTDAQPVFEAIADSAMRLFGAWSVGVDQCDGDLMRLAAARGGLPGSSEAYMARRQWRERPSQDTAVGRALRIGVVHIVDVEADPSWGAAFRQHAAERGFRSFLMVPMRRGPEAVGDIAVTRAQPGGFSAAEIALLQTFADQAVIAIENVRLFNETKEALERQTATSDILRIISSSPTDLQPVLDAVAERAANLCGAYDGSIFRVESGGLRLVAHHASMPAGPVGQFTLPLIRGTVAGRTVLERRLIHVTDLQQEVEEFAEGSTLARQFGHRTILSVPLLREGIGIGCIQIRRSDVNPFTQKQVELLQAFADQAVIAIENVRLFTELQASNKDLTEALDQQTATSDILRVISSSPTDVQPVFDAIVQNAVRLCKGFFGVVTRYDDHTIRVVAKQNIPPESLDPLRRALDQPGSITGRALASRTVVHVHDATTAAGLAATVATTTGYRTFISVPLLRDGQPIGTINLGRRELQPFSETEIELLKTFADQAVIAIENVRLFTELQTRNRELTTALDKQTATSDILRVISRSQTDVQPVFDAIVASAARLLGAHEGVLTRIVGDQIHHAASTFIAGDDPAARGRFPRPLNAEGSHAQAIRDRAPVNIADAQTDPALLEARRAAARARRYRSLAVVPLLRQDEALGTIAVGRGEAGGFTDDEIALLQTFADQAVIAIENARLLSELHARTQELTRSVGELTALGEVGRALSSTLDLETVLTTIVSQANQLAGTDGCSIFEYDESVEEFQLRASRYADPRDAAVLDPIGRATPIPKGQGLAGRAALLREPVHIPDIAVTGAYESPVRQPLLEAGYRALLGVPLLREEQVIGVLNVTRKTPGDFPPEIVRILMTFATQSALAIQNARLFREIEIKSRQLEVASQHKSEFLANMSHELRTPLNAIIGFSEVLTDRMFGELNEKQEEYLKDIYASGTHLLSLINDILDLSKIEAGRMELELTEFDLPTAIENALMLVRERAGRRSIALHTSIDSRLGEIQADERKVRQVVLNLLSNAIKFTPEGGRVDVGAAAKDGFVEISVADTGIGIAPEDQEKVFEEFRQVGTAAKKVEGTGLGLTLCRKFVELHGGTIWVKSQEGVGSTFTFTIPVSRRV